MRKTSLLLLFIALFTSLIIPVSALMSNVTLVGAVDWEGEANVRDTKNCIEVKIYSKKPFLKAITFTTAWPPPLSSVSTKEIESSIYINKKNGNVKMTFSWGDYKNPSINAYVLKARGTAEFQSDKVVITIKYVEIWERVKPNSFTEVYISEKTESIKYTLTI